VGQRHQLGEVVQRKTGEGERLVPRERAPFIEQGAFGGRDGHPGSSVRRVEGQRLERGA